MVSLEQLENFMRLLHKVQNVRRASRVPDEKEWRNTAEHTFEVTLLCWYIASANNLKLDNEKILKYALAHDLVEAYAGDVPVYDTEKQALKAKKESAALKRIERELSEFPELIQIIHTYEKREDEESKFVYAVDKLIDPLNASMEETQSIWKDLGMSYEQMRTYKDHKIKPCPSVFQYWQALMDKLDVKKDLFFGKEL